MTEYRCILCDRCFVLAGDGPVLPAHVYPSGLLRRRRCPSTYGIPTPEVAAPQPVLARV